MKTTGEGVLKLFPETMRQTWEKAAQLEGKLQEIRLRAGQPTFVYLGDGEWFWDRDGGPTKREDRAHRSSREELAQILKHICRYSLYAHEEEMGRGYVSAEGGFRIGLAGEVIAGPDGSVKNIRYVSSLNIRVAHERKGSAKGVLPYVYHFGRLLNTLIVSPPGCGKTTLLRDLIRLVSDGSKWAEGQTVGVVDERSEIAGCYQGVAQNDVGRRTDILDNCPKAQGMTMLLRSMTPRTMAVDELGTKEDVLALEQVVKCGCSILATLHAASYEDVCRKRFLEALLSQKVFSRFLILSKEDGRFRVAQVLDENGSLLGENL